MISAIVLAGAKGNEFGQNVTSRAMVKVGGITMLDRVVNALDCADEIIVVGDVKTDFDVTVMAPGEGLMENIKIASEKTMGDYILLCTSDIPFVTKKSINDFVEEGVKLDVGFVYPVCSKEKCTEIYPNLKRTYVKIKDGEFTGGNVMLMKKDFLKKVLPILQKLYFARKSPLKIAKMIGADIIWRLIFSKICPNLLDINYLENKISNLFGDKVKAYIAKDPAICEDLDSPDELGEFEKIIAEGEVL